jgi:hypothetical protein
MDKFGRDRSQFHLMRAQAHLANDDASRALRHLHKCKFGGSRPFPQASPTAPRYDGDHERAVYREEEIKKAGGEEAETAARKQRRADLESRLGGTIAARPPTEFGARSQYKLRNSKFGALPPGNEPVARPYAARLRDKYTKADKDAVERAQLIAHRTAQQAARDMELDKKGGVRD